MQKLKERINIQNVDTGDRSIEVDYDEAGIPIEEALSPFKNIDRASLPSGYDKPNKPSPQNVGEQENLQIFEDEKTTGESPFSSPRVLGEAEKEGAEEQPEELKHLKEELKENR